MRPLTDLAGAVLILILLEYGLRQLQANHIQSHLGVLILILLEYGLRPLTDQLVGKSISGLNPYSIGIWSATYLAPHRDTQRALS